MIRTEDHFAWNLTLLLVLLTLATVVTLAQWTGLPWLGLVYDPDSITGSALRIFFHADTTHFVSNVVGLVLFGSILAVFAHPFEFAGLTGLTVVAAASFDYYWLDASSGGLSALLFPFIGAVLVFLLAAVFDTGHLGSLQERVIVVGFALGFVAFVVFLNWGQIVHDFGVVVQGRPVGREYPEWYSAISSLVHVYGFAWGLLCAVVVRFVRHRLRTVSASLPP